MSKVKKQQIPVEDILISFIEEAENQDYVYDYIGELSCNLLTAIKIINGRRKK